MKVSKNYVEKILSLGLAIVMTLTMGTSAFVSENNQTSSEVTTIEDIYELETFVIREEDGTLSLDVQAALDNNGNPEAVEALQQHFSTINPQILDGQISTDDELNIIGGEHIISSHRCSLGSNSFTTFWWGYQRYACNCESERIVSDLNTWAAGGTMAGGAAAGAAFDTGYWWLLATRIDANNEGRGTITNMTHVLVFDIMPQ